MRIRQSLVRQESTDSQKPLIDNSRDNADTLTLSLASQRADEQLNRWASSSSNDLISRNSSSTSISRLSRPMAVININDSDPIDGRPVKKSLPDLPIQRKLSAPIGASASKSQVSLGANECRKQSQESSNSNEDTRRSTIDSQRTVSLRDSNQPVKKARLKHTTSSDDARGSSSRIQPIRKSTSQKQVRSSYGSRFTRAFTRKSGFNLIFDEVGNSFDSDQLSDSIENDLQKFEDLYQRVRKKLRRRRELADQTQDTSTSDTEMSPDNEDNRKFSFQKVFAGYRMRKWAFWFIVAFLAALTIKDVVELVTEYSENPKQSVINIVFNSTMTMPDITFCMGKNQAYSHFNLTVDTNWDNAIDEQLARLPNRESFLQKPWDYRMTVEGYEVISSLSSMERETESVHGIVHAITKFRELPRLESKRAMIRKWVTVLQERGVTFDEFTQKVGVETIKPALQRFQRLTFNENLKIQTKFYTSWISEQQFCFKPWSSDPNYMVVDDQGRFFSMILTHNSENLSNKSVNCMTVDFHGRPCSLNRFMEGKGRTRDGYNDELCMGQYHEVTVEVKALYEMLENNDNGTICREQKLGEDNEFDCKSRCRLNMLREWCHCTPLTLSYLMKSPQEEIKQYPLCDYTKCILDVQNRNYTDLDCQNNCHRDCRQVRYTVNHKSQGRLLKPDMTALELHWGSFEYLRMNQDWVWSVTTFIAALGGSIGMWLGLSILSLIQGGSYVYTYLNDTVIKRKIRKRRISVAASTLSDAKGDANLVTNPFENPFKAKISRQHSIAPAFPYKNRTANVQIE